MKKCGSLMEKRIPVLIGLCGMVFLGGCGAAYQPEITARNLKLLNCFPAEYSTGEKPACCEPSAGVMDGDLLLMASDKAVPEAKSSILQVKLNGELAGTIDSPLINRMEKIEALSRTSDHAWTVASSSFSYYIPDQAKYNRYSMLVAWPTGKPAEAQLIFPKLVDGEESSIGLNDAMRAALKNEKFPNGPDYFKIEGMTLTSDNKILFGVREQGAAYEDFDYSRTILAMDYQIVDGKFTVSGNITKLVDLQVPAMDGVPGYPAVSDLAFDEVHDILYVLTSFEGSDTPCPWSETENGLGGLLFYIPYDQLAAGQLRNVIDDTGAMVRFSRKSEGVALLPDKQLAIIYDDDRDLGKEGAPRREMNQTFYEILNLKK